MPWLKALHPSSHNSLTNSHLHLSSCSFFKIGLMTPILQTTQMLIILMLTLIFNIYKHKVDKWTSRRVNKLLAKRQSNIVSGQVNQLLTIKKNLFLYFVSLYKQLVYLSNLFTRLLPSITSNLSTRLTCQPYYTAISISEIRS